MKSKYLMAAFFAVLLMSSMVFALDKPPQINPLQNLKIKTTQYSIAGIPLDGQACTLEYATTGSYCSGSLRMYYQCLYQTVDSMAWEKWSEDCSAYSAYCVAGDCRGGYVSSDFSYLIVLMSAIIIAVLTLGLKKFTKMENKKIIWIDVIIILLIAFWISLGGV